MRGWQRDVATAYAHGLDDGRKGIEARPERMAGGFTRAYLDGHAHGKAQRDACEQCKRIKELGFGPDHNGSAACRNFRFGGHGAIAAGGDVAHCTCAGCF